MKKYFYSLFLFLIVLQFSTLSYGQTTQKERLEKHVYYMAADSLKGRKAGSKEAQKVAEYISNQFSTIGLETILYKFDFPIISLSSDGPYQNVIGVWEGSDSILKRELIVIGAHYDHLGTKLKKEEEIVYNGADDNASGTAALIELARNLVQQKELTKRTLVFVAFDAEEIGLQGSKFFINYVKAVKPVHKMVLMINFDMVGYLKQSGKLKIAGVGTVQNYLTYFNAVSFPESYRLVLKKKDHSILTGSDHDSFLAEQIPAFYVTTGLKSPYHKPEDDAHLIDYDGLSIIVDYFTELVPLFANDTHLKPSDGLKKTSFHDKKSYFGLTAGIGNMRYNYRYGTVDGKKGTALQLGLYGKVSLSNSFALKGEAAYSYTNRYRKEGIIQTHEVTFPVVLLLKSTYENWIEMSMGAGGYYSHFFHLREKNFDPIVKQYYPYEVGWILDFEMRVSRMIYGLQYRYGLNEMIVAPQEEDMARSRMFQFKIGFVF